MTPDRAVQRLFVEGPSDAAVVNKLVLLRLGTDLAQPPSHRIIEAPLVDAGFEGALRRFNSALEARRPERLGLVVDRDGEGKPDRWPAVRQVLERAALAPPQQPPKGGLRIDAEWGRVGVWLMPDNARAGDLESFLEELLPAPLPPTWALAASATDEAKALGATYDVAHRAKAVLHTWLAWQEPPGVPYGTALEARILEATSPPPMPSSTGSGDCLVPESAEPEPRVPVGSLRATTWVWRSPSGRPRAASSPRVRLTPATKGS